MLIPIRCFSCGRPIAHKWEPYLEKIEKGETKKKALDDLEISSFCCRAQFLGNVDLIDTIAEFKRV